MGELFVLADYIERHCTDEYAYTSVKGGSEAVSAVRRYSSAPELLLRALPSIPAACSALLQVLSEYESVWMVTDDLAQYLDTHLPVAFKHAQVQSRVSPEAFKVWSRLSLHVARMCAAVSRERRQARLTRVCNAFGSVLVRGAPRAWARQNAHTVYSALAQYFAIVPAPSDLSPLEPLIVEQENLLSHVMCENAAPEERGRLAKALVRVYTKSGRGLSLLRDFISEDVAAAQTPKDVLCPIGWAALMLTEYVSLTCTEYLKGALGPALEKSQLDQLGLEPDDAAALLEKHREELRCLAQLFIDYIATSVTSCPRGIKLIIGHLRACLISKFDRSDKVKKRALGGLVFGLLFCPAIRETDTASLFPIEDDPEIEDEEEQATLREHRVIARAEIARVLSLVATCTPAAESRLGFLTPWIGAHLPFMDSLLDAFTDVAWEDDIVDPPPRWNGSVSEDLRFVESRIRRRVSDLEQIAAHLTRATEKLSALVEMLVAERFERQKTKSPRSREQLSSLWLRKSPPTGPNMQARTSVSWPVYSPTSWPLAAQSRTDPSEHPVSAMVSLDERSQQCTGPGWLNSATALAPRVSKIFAELSADPVSRRTPSDDRAQHSTYAIHRPSSDNAEQVSCVETGQKGSQDQSRRVPSRDPETIRVPAGSPITPQQSSASLCPLMAVLGRMPSGNCGDTAAGQRYCTERGASDVHDNSSVVLVGMSAPFSGPHEFIGRAAADGLEAAFAEANLTMRLQFRLVARDDWYNYTLAAQNTRRLVCEDGAFAVAGSVGASSSEAVVAMLGALAAGLPDGAPKTKATRDDLRSIKHEITLLHKLHHPNLLMLMGFCETKTELIVISEYMGGGSLDQYLRQQKDAHNVFTLIAIAFPPVIHGNINTHNLLLDDKMGAKVSDFWFMSKRKLFSSGGSGLKSGGFLAPEIVAGNSPTTATDVYAFGVVLWELFLPVDRYAQLTASRSAGCSNAGTPGSDVQSGAVEMQVGPVAVTPEIPPTTPREVAQLLNRCWGPRPEERPSIFQILRSWPTTFAEIGVFQVPNDLGASTGVMSPQCQVLTQLPVQFCDSSYDPMVAVVPAEGPNGMMFQGTASCRMACPDGQICLEGRCQLAPPYTECRMFCGEGRRCINGRCVPDLCARVDCAEGSYCHPLLGECVRFPQSSPVALPRPTCRMACPEGQLCVEGGCRVPAPVAECRMFCGEGRRCIDGHCVDDICAGVECAEGLQCHPLYGQCVGFPTPSLPLPTCRMACPDGELCVEGRCRVPQLAPECRMYCGPGKRCLFSHCMADLCAGVRCKEGQECHPYYGLCVRSL
eukprot:m51a1_g4796 hypothetical protein (1312) ;mRNA; f:83211-93260